MQRVKLIYNPTAGRELVERQLPKLLQLLEKADLETSCIATENIWDAAKAAEQAAKREFDIVIAAGGDGTLHEVINGLMSHPNPPKLGILPAGTTNDFARALKLPRDLMGACKVITAGKTITIDLGKWNNRYFINVAATGQLTEIAYEAPSKLKTMVGPLAYYAKVIEKLVTLHETFPITLRTAEKEWDEELLLMIIANSVSVAGFEKLAPLASLSDSLFDVILVRKGNIPDLVHIAALAYKGEHIHDERVSYFQTSQMEVQVSDKLKLNLDGEWAGECNGIFSVVPKCLEIFCP